MDSFFIFSATYLFVLPILILGAYFLLQPMHAKKRMVVFALGSLVLTYALGVLAGRLYFDPRPFVVGHFTPLIPHAPDNGFPSDHALLVSAIATVGSYWNWKLGAVLWIIAIIIAVARVYVGVHHPVDVIGGIVIALVATTAVYVSLRYGMHREII